MKIVIKTAKATAVSSLHAGALSLVLGVSGAGSSFFVGSFSAVSVKL